MRGLMRASYSPYSAVLNNVLKPKMGKNTDLYVDLIWPLLDTLAVNPRVKTVRRSYDRASQSFTGYGMIFHRDDIGKIGWKKTSIMLLVGLMVVDGFSIWLTDVAVLIVARFFPGYSGGMLVGIGFAVISRTTQADRTFGYLLSIQFGLGGVGLMYLPPLVPEYGTAALFLSLIAYRLSPLASRL